MKNISTNSVNESVSNGVSNAVFPRPFSWAPALRALLLSASLLVLGTKS
jgi:hypothetical protein